MTQTCSKSDLNWSVCGIVGKMEGRAVSRTGTHVCLPHRHQSWLVAYELPSGGGVQLALGWIDPLDDTVWPAAPSG